VLENNNVPIDFRSLSGISTDSSDLFGVAGAGLTAKRENIRWVRDQVVNIDFAKF
jgi:hypothetical protein